MKKKALVAMSGGVDSAVAAMLLRDAGYDCAGAMFRLFDGLRGNLFGCGTNGDGIAGGGAADAVCAAAEPHDAAEPHAAADAFAADTFDDADARNTAARLGIPFFVLDFRGSFRRDVICRFVDAYKGGATPNPCVDCNRGVKFGRFMDYAAERGFDYIATGHYARVFAGGDSRLLLKKAADRAKDQSYMLYTLTQEQLARVVFPLGEYTKEAVREIARRGGLPNAQRPDSQDICFVPDGDYAAFIERFSGAPQQPGPFLDRTGAVVGTHRGLVRYTVGQRKKLGLAMNAPVYVYRKSAAQNAVYIGGEDMLYARSLLARAINLIACPRIDGTLRVAAKTRYRQQEQPATIRQTGPDEILVEFDEPQRAITPGQAVVFYDGDVVVGGGTISHDAPPLDFALGV